MELTDDYFAGRAAFVAARGKPFFLWLNLVEENEALGDEGHALRVAGLTKKVKAFCEAAEIAARIEIERYVRTIGIRADALAANKRSASPVNRLPPAPPDEVTHPTFGYVLLRRGQLTDEEILEDGRKLTDKTALTTTQRIRVSDEEILNAFSATKDNALASELRIWVEAQSSRRSRKSKVESTAQPRMKEMYFALDDEHALKCEAAAREVCRGLGMAEKDIEARGVAVLWPFARGDFNSGLAARSRWAVLKYVELSGEIHHQVRNEVLADAVRYPLPLWEPKNSK